MSGPACVARGPLAKNKSVKVSRRSFSASPALRGRMHRVPVRERPRGFRALPAAAFAHADETLRDDPYNLWTILCTIDSACLRKFDAQPRPNCA